MFENLPDELPNPPPLYITRADPRLNPAPLTGIAPRAQREIAAAVNDHREIYDHFREQYEQHREQYRNAYADYARTRDPRALERMRESLEGALAAHDEINASRLAVAEQVARWDRANRYVSENAVPFSLVTVNIAYAQDRAVLASALDAVEQLRRQRSRRGSVNPVRSLTKLASRSTGSLRKLFQRGSDAGATPSSRSGIGGLQKAFSSQFSLSGRRTREDRRDSPPPSVPPLPDPTDSRYTKVGKTTFEFVTPQAPIERRGESSSQAAGAGRADPSSHHASDRRGGPSSRQANRHAGIWEPELHDELNRMLSDHEDRISTVASRSGQALGTSSGGPTSGFPAPSASPLSVSSLLSQWPPQSPPPPAASPEPEITPLRPPPRPRDYPRSQRRTAFGEAMVRPPVLSAFIGRDELSMSQESSSLDRGAPGELDRSRELSDTSSVRETIRSESRASSYAESFDDDSRSISSFASMRADRHDDPGRSSGLRHPSSSGELAGSPWMRESYSPDLGRTDSLYEARGASSSPYAPPMRGHRQAQTESPSPSRSPSPSPFSPPSGDLQLSARSSTGSLSTSSESNGTGSSRRSGRGGR